MKDTKTDEVRKKTDKINYHKWKNMKRPKKEMEDLLVDEN
jgi:hypothetical protein